MNREKHHLPDKDCPPPIRLTVKLLQALDVALAYATAGGPADIGLDDSKPESHDTFADISLAHVWVGQELARRKNKRRRKIS